MVWFPWASSRLATSAWGLFSRLCGSWDVWAYSITSSVGCSSIWNFIIYSIVCSPLPGRFIRQDIGQMPLSKIHPKDLPIFKHLIAWRRSAHCSDPRNDMAKMKLKSCLSHHLFIAWRVAGSSVLSLGFVITTCCNCQIG